MGRVDLRGGERRAVALAGTGTYEEMGAGGSVVGRLQVACPTETRDCAADIALRWVSIQIE